MRKKGILFLTLAPLAIACASNPPPNPPVNTGQTLADAIQMFCNVDDLAAIPKEQEGFERGQSRSAWLAEHIENPDGIELRTLIGVKPAKEQAKTLREQAQSQNIQSCPLANSLESDETALLNPG